jgi:hypothetical protein
VADQININKKILPSRQKQASVTQFDFQLFTVSNLAVHSLTSNLGISTCDGASSSIQDIFVLDRGEAQADT